MKQELQLKYDDLLPEGWRPPLQSRHDLMEWACYAHANYLEQKEA